MMLLVFAGRILMSNHMRALWPMGCQHKGIGKSYRDRLRQAIRKCCLSIGSAVTTH